MRRVLPALEGQEHQRFPSSLDKRNNYQLSGIWDKPSPTNLPDATRDLRKWAERNVWAVVFKKKKKVYVEGY